MSLIYRKISSLKKLEDNPRKISPDELEKLKESLKSNPDYFEVRPLILSNRTGELVVIAGNQRLEACKQLGIKEVPTFLIENLTEEREREITIRDNVNNGEWDEEMLKAWNLDNLLDWGLDLDFSFCNEENEDKTYTKKISAPTYTPSEDVPTVSQLYNDSKVKELQNKIRNIEMDEEVRTFLMLAAYRHCVFDFRNIADYYASAPKEIQQLMEDSALVIIDFNKAIEENYVVLTNAISEQFRKDYDEGE